MRNPKRFLGPNSGPTTAIKPASFHLVFPMGASSNPASSTAFFVFSETDKMLVRYSIPGVYNVLETAILAGSLERSLIPTEVGPVASTTKEASKVSSAPSGARIRTPERVPVEEEEEARSEVMVP